IETVRLPGGLRIRVRPNEEIGRSLCTYGLYDLVTTEALVRLLEPGELALDIGANIGYMTGIMAARLGSRGRVISFEPSRRLFQELSLNVREWSTMAQLAPIEAHQLAISSRSGNAVLYLPEAFSRNSGLATLEARQDRDCVAENVQTIDLDGFMGPEPRVGLA